MWVYINLLRGTHLNLITCRSSNKIKILQPVRLHLAVEVGVCLLGCGVVGQELDICAQFFHNLISLSTWD